jgi:D-alanine transaminase
MEEVLTSLVKDCPFDEYFVYFQLSRYSEERCHAYPDTEKSNFLATVSKIELKQPTYRLKLISTPDIRYEMCDVKTLNLLPSVLASKRASDLGADEAVFYRGNTVTECAHSNIHIVKNGVIRTHPLDNHILPGISRKHMIFTAHRLGIKVIEEAFSLEELKKADEVIITSSSKLALCASELDEIRYDTEIFVIGKAICSAMRDDFEAFCSSLP